MLLSVNPVKLKLVTFTNKGKLLDINWPILFEKERELTDKVKHISINLDDKSPAEKTDFEV